MLRARNGREWLLLGIPFLLSVTQFALVLFFITNVHVSEESRLISAALFGNGALSVVIILTVILAPSWVKYSGVNRSKYIIAVLATLSPTTFSQIFPATSAMPYILALTPPLLRAYLGWDGFTLVINAAMYLALITLIGFLTYPASFSPKSAKV